MKLRRCFRSFAVLALASALFASGPSACMGGGECREAWFAQCPLSTDSACVFTIAGPRATATYLFPGLHDAMDALDGC